MNKIIWYLSLTMFIFILLYILFFNEKTIVYNSYGNIISHDDDVWYYNNIPTCVAYGVNDGVCPYFEYFCAGGKTFGSFHDQSKAVILAIRSGGEHPMCPLIYEGTN